jgi:hypothetical protein
MCEISWQGILLHLKKSHLKTEVAFNNDKLLFCFWHKLNIHDIDICHQ